MENLHRIFLTCVAFVSIHFVNWFVLTHVLKQLENTLKLSITQSIYHLFVSFLDHLINENNSFNIYDLGLCQVNPDVQLPSPPLLN